MFALFLLLAYPYLQGGCILSQVVYMPVKVLFCIEVALNSRRKSPGPESAANVCVISCRKDKTPEFADADHSRVVEKEDKHVRAGIHARET